MAFATGSGKGQPMADINVTPLVDVMLVLLIIFIVTAPVMTYPIDVDLPQRVINPPPQLREPPPPIELKHRRLRPGVPGTTTRSRSRLAGDDGERSAARSDQPAACCSIDANPDAQYDVMAKVLAAAKNAQMLKIGFVQQQ